MPDLSWIARDRVDEFGIKANDIENNSFSKIAPGKPVILLSILLKVNPLVKNEIVDRSRDTWKRLGSLKLRFC